MFDHVATSVSDYAAGKAFFAQAPAPHIPSVVFP